MDIAEWTGQAANIANCGNDPAPITAPNDNWLVCQLRPIALLHGGVEAVAIDVPDRQCVEFRMRE